LKVIKIGTKLKLPYNKDGVPIVDKVIDIELRFNEGEIYTLIITEGGYIVYDDQMDSVEILED
jgi:hypothetical protein